MTKAIRILAFGLLAAGIILAADYLNSMYSNIRLSNQLKDDLATAQTVQETTATSQRAPTETTTSVTRPTTMATSRVTEPTVLQTDPFAGLRQPAWTTVSNPLMALFEQNNDLIGWIKIADTRIDYPIVKGRDNEFYLERDFNREKSKAGSIFMDYRNIGDGQDGHTIIYGHRMKDKTMFADLMRFKDPSFYKNHRVIAIDTLYGRKEYKVFAAYTTNTDFHFIETRFETISRQAFIQEIQKRSVHEWDVDIREDDRILTLATCTYDFEDARFVVHAVLLDSK